MHHAVNIRHDLNKSAEISYAHYLAGIDPADGRSFGHSLDPFAGNGLTHAVHRGNVHCAVIRDVDLGAGFFLKCADILSARAYNSPNFLHRHFDDGDARGMRLERFARFRDCGRDLTQDALAGFFGLCQRGAHDLRGDTLDLDIHLQGGDTLFGSCNLEVHVTQVVFQSLDVRQDLEGVAFLNQTHRHAGYRGFDRHTGIHQRQRGAAHRSHRAGPVGGQYFRDQAQGIREVFFGGDNRHQCPFRQGAVADLTPALAAQLLDLAGRIRREVVMVDIAFGIVR